MVKEFYFYLLIGMVAFTSLPLNGYLASVLFLLIAFLLWQIEKSNNKLISPVAFVIVAYVLGFPVVMVLPDLYEDLWSRMSPFTIEFTMLWVVRGFGAFALGYVLVERFYTSTDGVLFGREGSLGERKEYLNYFLKAIGLLSFAAWLLTAIIFGISLVFLEGKGVDVSSAAGSLLQILTFLSGLRYPFFFCFLMLYYWKQADKPLVFLFWGLIVISLIEIIIIGSKGVVLRILIVCLLALCYLPIKFSFKQLVLGVVAVLLVYGSFAVITEYRYIMKNEYRYGANVFSFDVQISSFKAAVIASLPFMRSSSDRHTEVGHEQVLGRFSSGMFSFANLINFTRRQPPYENALESFLVPIYSIAPRALVPDKPVFFNSGRNAREYYRWSYGGVSVTLLGSLYYAWGYFGILFGMLSSGCLLAFIVTKVQKMGIYSMHWLILLVVLLLPLLDVGVTFQAISIDFIRVIVLLWLLKIIFPVFSR